MSETMHDSMNDPGNVPVRQAGTGQGSGEAALAGPEPSAADIERELDQMCEAAYDDATRRLAGSFVLLDADAGRLEDRRYDVAGVQVAVSLRLQGNCIRLFADIGLPAPDHAPAACRRLLELNHSGPHGGMRFGMHPRSRRLVATAQVQVLDLYQEPELAVTMAAGLADQARALRDTL